MENHSLKKMAQVYGKSVAQILIRYQRQRGLIVIPKSVSEKRIKENMEIEDFQLSESDMNILDSMDCNLRYLHHLWVSIL